MAYSRPEPLSGNHDLEDFRSGEQSLDGWLLRHARTAEATNSARVFVTTAGGTNVVGFYALSAGVVEAADATTRLMKGQPAGRSVPVAILGRLAVDHRHQGKGVGESLLQDALLHAATASESIAIRAVIVHALNDAVRDWYLRYGFEASPTDPLHLILLMKDLRKLLDEAEVS